MAGRERERENKPLKRSRPRAARRSRNTPGETSGKYLEKLWRSKWEIVWFIHCEMNVSPISGALFALVKELNKEVTIPEFGAPYLC